MNHDKMINMPWVLERNAPPFEGNDIKTPEGLYRYLYKKYTKAGDKIFDPFAGLGTSLFVAEEMKRIPFGIEAETNKFEWVAGQLEHWTHVISDDAARLHHYKLPKMDLVVTCPPFMEKTDQWNPLYAGDPKQAGYDKYLKRMAYIMGKLPIIMKRDTVFVLQVDNIQSKKGFTPLIHNMAQCVAKHFAQIGEIIVTWEQNSSEHSKDYPFTTLLIFKKK